MECSRRPLEADLPHAVGGFIANARIESEVEQPMQMDGILVVAGIEEMVFQLSAAANVTLLLVEEWLGFPTPDPPNDHVPFHPILEVDAPILTGHPVPARA